VHWLILDVPGGADKRRAAALAVAERLGPVVAVELRAAAMPFDGSFWTDLPTVGPRVLLMPDLHLAFPNNQRTGTRLVLTQATYLLQKWLDRLAPGDLIVATADRAALAEGASEAFERRGAWRQFQFAPVEHPAHVAERVAQPCLLQGPTSAAMVDRLIRAYSSTDGAERMRLAAEAVACAPDSPIATLSMASACREQSDMDAARGMLERTLELAPQWEAAHYEDGKFWLGCEDLPRARGAFERAAALMPTFSAAFSNLGATLGELNQPEAALAAFEHALKTDPDNHTALNNLGVVGRELGHLDTSEAALRRVTTLNPEFVFGHYNLGHTLFIKGDFAGAIRAYEEGQRRDQLQNARQACRLAMVRFASGDVDRAERELRVHVDSAADRGEREDLLAEAYETASMLVRARPELAAHKAFVDRIAALLETGR
jgi:tetratricopeptide (TPR) repeat protein